MKNAHRIIVLLLVLSCSLISCGKKHTIKNSYTEEDALAFIVSYADNYTVENESDGGKTVIINAPDFLHYLEIDEEKEEVMLGELERSIVNDKNPQMKEYRFQLETVDDESVKKAFLDSVSYDLVMNSIIDLE